MSAKFLDGLGGKLAEQWVATLLTPAFVFWAGGATAILQRFGWTSISGWFSQQPEALQIAALIGLLCLIVASAFAIQRFDLAVLRFLEGYWHPILRAPRQWLVERQVAYSRKLNRKYQSLTQELSLFQLTKHQESEFQVRIALENFTPRDWRKFQQLRQQVQRTDHQEREFQNLIALNHFTQTDWDEFQNLLKRIQQSHKKQEEFAQIDWQLMHRPLIGQLMPTRLGNLLRAAERKPLEKYGLDAVICWPRLWLLLPDAAKKDLQDARADLNAAARVWLWSLLFMLWTLLGAWWAVPVGLLSMAFAYYGWLLNAAATYADLLESAFDLYRPLLYRLLRWPLPSNPQEERQWGKALTIYLWRGLEADRLTFTPLD